MPPRSEALSDARRSGARNYLGKVCQKHPSAGGRRYTSSSECVKCANEKVAAYRSTPRGKKNVLDNARRRKYRIEPAAFAILLKDQGRRCAICRTRKPGGRNNTWQLDHDHKVGKPRGILCTRCNLGLGHFEDNTERMRCAIRYLEKTT